MVGHFKAKAKLLAALFVATWSTMPTALASGEKVYVIAKSVSTDMEAMSILAKEKWQAVPLRQADFALVVVRSELDDPLNWISDDNIWKIEEDADRQLNISGDNYVTYLFHLDEKLRPTLLRHFSYPARD